MTGEAVSGLTSYEVGEKVEVQGPLSGLWIAAVVVGHDEDARVQVKVGWHSKVLTPDPLQIRRITYHGSTR